MPRHRKIVTIQNIGILVLIAPLALGAAPQFIGGPVLGLISDSGGTAIRPVIGIPGASMLGKPLELEVEIQGAIISQKQDYAIASRATDGQAILIDMAAEPPAVIPVA